MKLPLYLLIPAILLLIDTAMAVDGIAVSVAYRTGSNNNYIAHHKPSFVPECNPNEPGWGWGYYYLRGQIVKYTVKNNIPDAGDTIYRGLRDGLAQYPSLSFDGTKVAFFRWGCFVGKSPSSGADTLLGQSDPAHISIINVDGTGLNNRITLPASPAFESALEWSADGWIYYTRPRSTYTWYWQRESREIWRVKVADPSVNQVVASYATSDPADTFFHCATWTMSKSGGFALFTRSDTAISIAHIFPPAQSDYRAKGMLVLPGKDAAISPGGNCIALFEDATNTRASIYKWIPSSGKLDPSKVMTSFGTDDTQWWRNVAGGGYGQSGGGWINARFAANSEKWVAMQLGSSGTSYIGIIGGNQQIVNWYDRLAIQTQSIAPNGDIFDGTSIRRGNTTGDFWVQPPAGVSGAYERWDGKWIPVFNQPSIILSWDSLSVKPGDTLRVSAIVVDFTGRPVTPQPTLSWSIGSGQIITPSAVSAASCLFRAKAAGGPFFLIASANGFIADTTQIMVLDSPEMPIDRSNWSCFAIAGTEASLREVADGLAGSCWNTRVQQRAGQWFMIDMQSQHSLCRALIRGEENGDYPRAYSACVSVDGVIWDTVLSQGHATSNVIDIRFSPHTARYFKIVITADGPQYVPFWSICEANLYTSNIYDLASLRQSRFLKSASPISIIQTSTDLLFGLQSGSARRIAIFSAQGSIVYRCESRGTLTHGIPISRWTNGIYFVRIQTGNEILTRSLTIRR